MSAYALQVGRSQDEKDEFWEVLWKLIEGVKQSEKIILQGDLNGHIGKNSEGYEGLHDGHRYGVRNMEGERILEFCEAVGDDCVAYSLVRQSKLISYSSGGYNTTVDYLLAQKQDRKFLKDAKAFPEEVISLHCLIQGFLNFLRYAHPLMCHPNLHPTQLQNQKTLNRTTIYLQLTFISEKDVVVFCKPKV